MRFVQNTRSLSVTKPVTEIYRGPDARRRKFLMALAATLIAAQTFTDRTGKSSNVSQVKIPVAPRVRRG